MRFLVDELEALGYRWAYRLVDSRFTGVPQRRQRVIFLASQDIDPRTVLFADEAGEPIERHFRDDVYGFYWTEGIRGLGWAKDAVPTLRVVRQSVSRRRRDLERARSRPSHRDSRVEEAEQMQGFRQGLDRARQRSVESQGNPVEANCKYGDCRRFTMGWRTSRESWITDI